MGHGLLSSAIFADHCGAYSGRRSQCCCFWGYEKEHLGGNCPERHAPCVKGQGRKLGYYHPLLVKEKTDF